MFVVGSSNSTLSNRQLLSHRKIETLASIIKSLKDNMKSNKHIRMRLKAVRKLRNSGVIALEYVHTAKNLADPFTKGLSRVVIDNASTEMGMRPT